MKIDTVVGPKIAYYRCLNGWTQEELAEKIGVSVQAVSRWEHSTANPEIGRLPALADCFHITIDELFGRDPDPKSGGDCIQKTRCCRDF